MTGSAETAPSPEYQYIRIEHDGPLTWIVLDRSDRANALSNDLLDELTHSRVIPGSVQIRTGGDSPRPTGSQSVVDLVEFRDRR